MSGLQIGNNIWFSGVKIGVVNKLHFYGKSQVEVTMKIDVNSQQYIRKDAFVKIGTDGLIGNKILVIYGGTGMANKVNDGDTLEVEKTFTNEDMINMLQENNKNVLAITSDFKTISQNVLAGQGSVGKFLKEDAIYDNMNNATKSLALASVKAQVIVNSLNEFSEGLNKKGTFANDLVNDTMVFNSIQKSAAQLQQMTLKANTLVAKLNEASSNPNSALGVLLYDEVSGSQVKETLKNLETSSEKLDENLEALQHNFLLRGFFKRKAKAAKKQK